MPYDLAQRLKEAKQRAAVRRCEAFVDYSPTVCRLALRPITLASYNMLVAFENAFVTGAPVTVEAVAEFVWVHHPAFAQAAHRARRRVLRRIGRALFPRFPRINILLRLYSLRFRWLRRFTVATHEERLSLAATEIRRLLSEGMGDMPRPMVRDEEDDGEKRLGFRRADEPPPLAFMAQVLNGQRRALAMSYAETEGMPLKRLTQFIRERTYFAAGGKGLDLSLMSREEAAIWREHFDRKNTPASAAS